MPKICLLMPSILAPETATLEATQRLIRFSSCKCASDGMEWAAEAAELARAGRQKHIPRPSGDWFHNPAQCPRGKSQVVFSPSYQASILHWARNQSIADALKNHPDFSHLLLVDSDMTFGEDALDRLLAHQKDIVSGTCVKRVDPAVPVAKIWSERYQNYAELRDWPDETGLIEVDAVGAAFLLLTRKVILDLAEAYHPKEFRESGNGWWFSYRKNVNGGELGEDVSMCWAAARLGFRIWLDTDLQIGHLGKYVYTLEDWKAWREPYLKGEVGPHKDARQLVKV